MEITNDLIDHIAHLSRLQFEGDKKDAIRNDLGRIINFMEKLQEVDTENVEPLIFEGAGHFSLDQGWGQWSGLTAWIESANPQDLMQH